MAASVFNAEMLVRGKRKVLHVPFDGGGGHAGSSAPSLDGAMIFSIDRGPDQH